MHVCNTITTGCLLLLLSLMNHPTSCLPHQGYKNIAESRACGPCICHEVYGDKDNAASPKRETYTNQTHGNVVIDCSDKNLTSIAALIDQITPKLDSMANVVEIDLSHNPRMMGSSDTVYSYSKPKPSQSLCGVFTKMRKLSLAWNNLTRLPPIFEGCEDTLHILVLTGNHLHTLDSTSLQGGDLASLQDLHDLELVGKPRVGMLTELKRLENLVLRCSYSHLTVGLLSGLISLRNLSLTVVKASALPENLFGLGGTNSLSLSHVSLSGPKVKSVPITLWDELKELKSMKLHLPSLYELDFATVSRPKHYKYLEALEIQGVNILSADALHGMKVLKFLKLGDIREVSKVRLSDVGPTLQRLEIVDCTIKSLPSHWFSLLAAVQSLTLSKNNLELLDNSSFDGLTSLTHLDLTGNKISAMGREVLRPLQHSLKVLEFGDNMLRVVETATFSNLSQLQSLNLSQNSIIRVKTNAFQDLPQLLRLFMNGNYLQTLDEQTVQFLPQLEHVELADNLLQDFPVWLLHGMLIELRLSGNFQLRMLPVQEICQAQRLKKLILTDCPILCSCAVRRLKLCKVDMEGTCSEPPDQEGKDLNKLELCPQVTSTAAAYPSTSTSHLAVFNKITTVATSVTKKTSNNHLKQTNVLKKIIQLIPTKRLTISQSELDMKLSSKTLPTIKTSAATIDISLSGAHSSKLSTLEGKTMSGSNQIDKGIVGDDSDEMGNIDADSVAKAKVVKSQFIMRNNSFVAAEDESRKGSTNIEEDLRNIDSSSQDNGNVSSTFFLTFMNLSAVESNVTSPESEPTAMASRVSEDSSGLSEKNSILLALWVAALVTCVLVVGVWLFQSKWRHASYSLWSGETTDSSHSHPQLQS